MNRALLPLAWTHLSDLTALWGQEHYNRNCREAPVSEHVANNVGNENTLYPHFIPLLFSHFVMASLDSCQTTDEKHPCAAKP